MFLKSSKQNKDIFDPNKPAGKDGLNKILDELRASNQSRKSESTVNSKKTKHSPSYHQEGNHFVGKKSINSVVSDDIKRQETITPDEREIGYLRLSEALNDLRKEGKPARQKRYSIERYLNNRNLSDPLPDFKVDSVNYCGTGHEETQMLSGETTEYNHQCQNSVDKENLKDDYPGGEEKPVGRDGLKHYLNFDSVNKFCNMDSEIVSSVAKNSSPVAVEEEKKPRRKLLVKIVTYFAWFIAATVVFIVIKNELILQDLLMP